MTELYKSLGASADKQGLHSVLGSIGLEPDPNLFCQVFPCPQTSSSNGSKDGYACFVHCDGAGTKTIVAHIMHTLTGSTTWFGGLAQDALVMNLDDVFCLGTPTDLMLANFVNRSLRLISDQCLATILLRYQTLVSELTEHGIRITLAGGETADCGDSVRTLVVDAVLTGRINAKNIIRLDNICAGDVIIGLSSTGQASYETEPNSGIGSNGLTLARHALLSRHKLSCLTEVVDPGLDPQQTYRGPFAPDDYPEDLGMSVGEALLSPTRSYAPLLQGIYEQCAADIHGAIHCTGGGQTKIMRFAPKLRIVKDSLFPTPPIFRLIQQHSQVDWKEMYKVFNMGHRFELYVPESASNRIFSLAKLYNIDARQVGYVEKSPDEKSHLHISSDHGEFNFSY